MQNINTLSRSRTGSSLLLATVTLLLWLPVSGVAVAQSTELSPSTSTVAPVIPQQVRYTGASPNRAGVTVEAVFKIYATADGGEPLWTETQQVPVAPDGSYSVLLGAASQGGLPQTVFAAGQARWVGVSIDRADEQPRSPLSSVAYAMKAGDAESVGGLAAASFATKDDLAKLTKLTQTVATAVQAQPEVAPTGTGTANYVPLWTDSVTLGNSGIYQAPSGFIGIGTTTPGGPLELATGAQGGANATMMLEQTSAAGGNYYANLGLYNTHGLIGNLSALGAGYPAGNLFGANDIVFLGGQQNAGTNLIMLTNTAGALKFGTGGYAISNERLRIGAAGGVSVGNPYVGTDPGAGNMILSGNLGVGTTAPGATLEVNGTAKFDGLITFASGQTFPGAGGSSSLTAITTTSPLTGGGTSGSIALALNTAALETTLNGVYAQLGAVNKFTYAPTFNAGLVSKVAFGPGNDAILAYGTNGSGALYASSDSGYGVQATSTSGTAVSGVSTSGAGVTGTSTSGSAGSFSNASNNFAALYATNTANFSSGYLPTAVDGTATGTSSVGVYGSGTKYGVSGSSTNVGGIGVNGGASEGTGGLFGNNSVGYATVYANNFAPGSASGGPVVIQADASGINAASIDGQATGNGSYGVYGESDGTTETGSGRVAVGVEGYAKGVDSFGVFGLASGKGSFGVFARASGSVDTNGMHAAGVYALGDTGSGVVGITIGQSGVYNTLAPLQTAGVWGDTSETGGGLSAAAGIVGTAGSNHAGYFENSSASSGTIVAFNDNTGGTGLFKVFKAATPDGTCGIGDGDLSCTGQLKTLAKTSGDGGRTVETYAMQSPENWMEDFGTGSVERGAGVVQIDPAFANTVTGDASYHVFLTPRGDAEGSLYVTNVTATSFEVRESHGGKSTLSFDYRIVAKRRGYEAQRLVDVTDRFNAEQAETKRLTPDVSSAAPSKGMREPQMGLPGNLQRAAQVLPASPNLKPGGGSPIPQASMIRQNTLAKPVEQK